MTYEILHWCRNMPLFTEMEVGEVDVFITTSTFFTGIFLRMLHKLDDANTCPDALCSTYGVFLIMTSVCWSFLAAVSILYRLHYNEGVNYIVVFAVHVLMRCAIAASLTSINLYVWHNAGPTLGPVSGLVAGTFVSVSSLFLLAFFVYDYWLSPKKN